MANTSFITSNQIYRQIIGNGLLYNVPSFQRDYSWTEKEWEELWQDLLENLGVGSSHYMGYLVLQTKDNKHKDIIDGQQRLTTLSLLILAILKHLQKLINSQIEAEENSQRLNQLRSSFIGFLDPVTLQTRNKLTLNRNNNRFYASYLATLLDPPRRNLKPSEHLLRNAFDWFYNQLSKDPRVEVTAGNKLAELAEKVADNLFFTVIEVDDELNAYKVFETLNARGVQLSTSDLLKNYLFSVVAQGEAHEHELTKLEEDWNHIVDKLREDEFTDFLRAFWNSRNKLTRKASLYKTIRENVKDRESVFALLRELDTCVDIYQALSDENDETWTGNPVIKYAIKELNLLRIKQPIPLLMSAYLNLDTSSFTTLIKALVSISFRYNTIGGKNPNDQEDAYNKMAIAINKDKTLNWDLLRPIYLQDEEFKSAFEYYSLTYSSRNATLAKYILTKLEVAKSEQSVNFEDARVTLEHIMPRNPEEGWDVSDDVLLSATLRLGNLCILEKTLNQNIENKGYEAVKRNAYLLSNYTLTKEIAEGYDHWDENSINRRQVELARLAKTVWKVSQLSH